LLEEVAVSALLHDVGYMRLPLNLVQAWWGRTGIDHTLLRQHVTIGMALIDKKSQFSHEIVQMVREHHAYQDGSGYPNVQSGEPVSASGKLLGLADYFDELLAEGNTSGTFPVALAIRRMYQEAQKGKFPLLFVEALIRVFGVYPVGTIVQLSTGEHAVVVKQNPEVSVKPHVKIIRAPNGQILAEPEVKNLVLDADLGHEVSIMKVLNPADHSINFREIFS
jgi:HD-GYP domain-containing protein (c-di-GMP phosphodiesterase class II)